MNLESTSGGTTGVCAGAVVGRSGYGVCAGAVVGRSAYGVLAGASVSFHLPVDPPAPVSVSGLGLGLDHALEGRRSFSYRNPELAI
ncbi:hypothetical protein [Streptomyces olivochromogenes]|uniref:hypothetical protein n=1 Tax=Streptomyces olivochromogenes TaxID=1963 RepID=UPI0036CF7758